MRKSLEKKEENVRCRFRTAAELITKYKYDPVLPAVDYSFNVLAKVVLEGSWSIVYDIKNMEIHFKTASNQAIRKIQINDFNFNCDESAKLYDLKKKEEGVINNCFVDYTEELNNNKFEEAIKSNLIQLPKSILNMFYNYNKTCFCEI